MLLRSCNALSIFFKSLKFIKVDVQIREMPSPLAMRNHCTFTQLHTSSEKHCSWFACTCPRALAAPPNSNPHCICGATCQALTRCVVLPNGALLHIHPTGLLLLQDWDGRSLCQFLRQRSKEQESWTIYLNKWGVCDIAHIQPTYSKFQLTVHTFPKKCTNSSEKSSSFKYASEHQKQQTRLAIFLPCCRNACIILFVHSHRREWFKMLLSPLICTFWPLILAHGRASMELAIPLCCPQPHTFTAESHDYSCDSILVDHSNRRIGDEVWDTRCKSNNNNQCRTWLEN